MPGVSKASLGNPTFQLYEFTKKKVFSLYLLKLLLLQPLNESMPLFKEDPLTICACGVIGSRARLRIWWSDPWGFESLHAHRRLSRNVGAVLYFSNFI